MKYFKVLLLIIVLSTQVTAQDSIDDLINKGVKYHDNGDYDKAIEMYKKALKIDKKSPLVNYEIAYTYFAKKDYMTSVKYSNVVLAQESKLKVPAYLIKGSALDMAGKVDDSIKMFKKAIKENKPHHLLNYNLALNYFKIKEYESAEESVLEAIEINQFHSTSHLLLAYLYDIKGKAVQTLLAVHYFLLLEPNSKRSSEGYELLQKHFAGNVSRDKDDPKKININLSPSKDEQFAAAELMIAMLEANRMIEENKDKSDEEMFVENTTSFFTVLGELKKKKNKGIWWELYVPFFYKLSETKHIEAYCHYISQNSSEKSQEWLKSNMDKLEGFGEWLKEQ